ncbi:MAG: VOC family protein [Acidimicrobiia bacterium]|nr:VOC family protein [Acidimicrobiia bacterium]
MQVMAMLPAADVGRAKDWYHRMLDLTPVEETENGDAWFETGGTKFLVYGSAFAGANQATAASVAVDDFEATISVLKSRGATFEDYDFGDELRTVDGVFTTPEGDMVAWLKDSEGNILAIMKPA